MTVPGTRRVRRFLLTLLATPAALGVTSTAGASTPPTVPPGYVQLFDDTRTITVVAPVTWADITTAPGTNEDGTPQPWISAAPDYEAFRTTLEASGFQYFALPYTADPESLVEDFGMPEGVCAELEQTDYDDGLFVGVGQLGESCGETGETTWVLVVANPPDQAFTAVLQIQSANEADDEAVVMILDTFNRTADLGAPGSTVAASTPQSTEVPATEPPFVPSVSIPAGLGPVEVATTFLDALAAGDGATACALLTAEEMTINFVEEARTCDLEMTLQVLGQGDFWSSVQIEGDETTSSPGQCGDEDPADEYVSLELRGPTDDGCLSISIDNGEWRIEDLSNSIWNQATADPSSTTSLGLRGRGTQ
jgi:hypothetical protein